MPQWRTDYDREVLQRLSACDPDVCVLAGYMLILVAEMCRRYAMINLHPAVPGGPVGTWKEVIWKLIDTRAKSTGAMMHLVTPVLDKGPVVTYCKFPIVGGEFDRLWAEIDGCNAADIKATQGENSPLFLLIRKHGATRELPLIISTLKAFSEHRVDVQGGRIVDSSGNELQGYDLSAEVDASVKGILG